jgi:2-polyprenyl-6-methoxyphenol hydroxylase-like FAD-dependent oxidoreductase
MPVLRTPVLVVGAGVAGCVLALELAHHGVPSLVVERASAPPAHPDLNFVNGRSMELLRRLGLTTAMRNRGIHPDCPADLVWSGGLDQPPVLVSQLPSVNELRRAYAISTDSDTPLEPYLLLSGAHLVGRLRDAVRAHPLADLRDGWIFTGLTPAGPPAEPSGVVAAVLEAATGARHTVEARYLAGCDGAHSTVRRSLGVPMEQLSEPAQYYTVYFRNAHLAHQSPHPTTIVAADVTLTWRHDQRIWIGQISLDADEATVADPAALLHHRLGVPLDPPEILGVTQTDDALAVATAYRRGPAFLVGESAHRFHPPGGTVDTCVGDAVDLGWKLAAAVHGWGGPELLDSYQDERRRQAMVDRDLLSRAMETRRRFGRLAAAGAAPDVLAGVLREEPSAAETAAADACAGSPLVWHETPADPAGSPATRPGARAPSVRLAGGEPLFDRLGPLFTLVDGTGPGYGRPLVAAAAARGVPMTHLPVAAADVRGGWSDGLLLIRPDYHIAWRAERTPSDWDLVLDVITGHCRQDHVNA